METTFNLYDNQLFVYFEEVIWPYLQPTFWVLNILGICFVIYLAYRYFETKKKIAAVNAEVDGMYEGQFAWVKEKPKKSPRWDRIEKLVASGNSSDWRVAILEADSILDELVQKTGAPGDDMGERMRNLSSQSFPFLDEAWRVHKLRNVIAHETDYDLQKGETEDAIDAYNLIFKTMDYMV